MNPLDLIQKRIDDLELERSRGRQQLEELEQAVVNTKSALERINGAIIALSEIVQALKQEPNE